MSTAQHAIDRPRPSQAMFWLLVIPASALFSACVLVPVWEDYRAMALAERLEAETVAQMRADIDRLRRHLDGLRNDPGVIARVAQRDLGYRKMNQQSVYVGLEPAGPRLDDGHFAADREPPSMLDAYLNRPLLAQHRDALLDRVTRIRLMCLSGAVMAAALILFPLRRRQPA